MEEVSCFPVKRRSLPCQEDTAEEHQQNSSGGQRHGHEDADDHCQQGCLPQAGEDLPRACLQNHDGKHALLPTRSQPMAANTALDQFTIVQSGVNRLPVRAQMSEDHHPLCS
jgi:hypothetical protein